LGNQAKGFKKKTASGETSQSMECGAKHKAACRHVVSFHNMSKSSRGTASSNDNHRRFELPM
jgi:hypothetical protein